MKQHNEVKWTRLDNASKVFPATYSNKDTKVFRFACELNEDVDPEVLQQALNLSIESFPFYKSVLRRGLFWYYFESSDIEPKVELESHPLCAPIYIKDKRNLLFRVFYYNKRINLEIFHALTDGAGVIWFMETLVYHYITIKYKESFLDGIPKLSFKASISEKMVDSFGKNYSKENVGPKPKSNKDMDSSNAFKIKGTRLIENRMKLIEGSMSVRSVIDIAHKYNTTLTIFMTSLLLYSIHKEMPANRRNRPITLSVPINLRQYYESVTARNFFSTMNISYNFGKSSSEFEDIIASVSESFKKGLTKENMDQQLHHFMSLERHPIMRLIPLPLKDLLIRIANKLQDKKITSSISNIGRINMPIEFNDYINQFSICVSARRPLITLCSFGDRMVVSFTSPFEETDIQRTFFQFLSKEEVKIEILSNV